MDKNDFMIIDFDETIVMRIKLNIDEVQDIQKGRRIYADVDQCLLLEISCPELNPYPTQTLEGKKNEP